MSRYDWPVHFGLLNNDCRWIVDEVQLMGPGLWTTAQLDWMRRVRFAAQAPSPTTWMSATLDESFLATTDRRQDGMGEARDVLTMGDPANKLPPQAAEELARRRAAVRPVEVIDPPATGADRSRWLAEQVAQAHTPGTLSFVVCNTVATARAAGQPWALLKDAALDGPPAVPSLPSSGGALARLSCSTSISGRDYGLTPRRPPPDSNRDLSLVGPVMASSSDGRTQLSSASIWS
jgi:hypothetical protein